MQTAETVLVKAAQAISFENEIEILKSNQVPQEVKTTQRKSIAKSSTPLHKLDPFLDQSGILRVGRRLR